MKAIIAILTAGMLAAAPVLADDPTYDNALADIKATLGSVPTWLSQMPRAGFAGAWFQLKGLEFAEDTALDAKTKALIELAVVAQIPCQYCVWADTAAAKAAGASDEEIREAVAVAATGRFWSTMLNGLQTDFDTFKAEFGPLVGVTP